MQVTSSRQENRLRGRLARLRRDGVGGFLVAAGVEVGLGTHRFLRTYDRK
jgi:hypothetical protein